MIAVQTILSKFGNVLVCDVSQAVGVRPLEPPTKPRRRRWFQDLSRKLRGIDTSTRDLGGIDTLTQGVGSIVGQPGFAIEDVEPLVNRGDSFLFKARLSSLLGQEVAVKRRIIRDEVDRNKAARELELANFFNGRDGFVTMHMATNKTAVAAGEDVYLVMELASGNLGDILNLTTAEFPQVARLELFVQVLRAVCEMHEAGVVHLDLKPANVLILGDLAAPSTCKPVLCDLGDACSLPGGRWPAVPCENAGTPLYMAPESWSLGAVSLGRDVWAMGLVLYQLLFTGELPVVLRSVRHAHTARVKVEKTFRIEDDPEFIGLRRHDPPLADLLRSMLDRDAATRISATEALRRAERLATKRGWVPPASENERQSQGETDRARAAFGKEFGNIGQAVMRMSWIR